MSTPAIPQIGQLFFGGKVNGLQVWTQPGGTGTTVYPQQQPGQQVAMFAMPYCGHWTNNIDIRIEIWNPPSFEANFYQPAAFILCPLCSCVARIVYPPSLVYDIVSNYIVLP